MEVILIIMLVGVIIAAIGVIKAIKSRFTDLMAIIWCWAGSVITTLATILSIVIG